jgi:repressor LexA
LTRLEIKELIQIAELKPRTSRIVGDEEAEDKGYYTSKEMVDVPIVGKVTAGLPILAVENVEDTFPLPIDFVGNSESFMLKVRGDSMIDAGILDGDLVLVKKQNTAENGDIVVALIEDEATVKKFYKEKGFIRLQPQNQFMQPILVPTCTILGKVAGVFRKL